MSHASDFTSPASHADPSLGIGFGPEQFVRCEIGHFVMGSELDADNPPHDVTLRRSFLLQRTPVTQAQWEAVMGSNPSDFSGDVLRPVESVSWTDTQEFLAALESRSGVKHRLPTDAEWEYACRAGGSGNISGDLDPHAWFRANSQGTTHPVATRTPNAWGVYDMHGNVCEWVNDYYSPISTDRVVDPTGSAYSTTRVIRGGSWFNQAIVARGMPRGSLDDEARNNMTGFRLVRLG